MQLSDFHYDLPDELIARYPLPSRSTSRLLRLQKNSSQISHHQFFNIVDFLKPNDILVLNNTKVLKARLFGKKASGGVVELLLERAMDDTHCLMHSRANKPIKPGLVVHIAEGITFEAIEKKDGLWCFKVTAPCSLDDILEQHGHVPLPPYFNRQDEAEDEQRYQTVFAKHPGAVAAPTAGLHFDDDLLDQIKAKGIKVVYVTLHVGAGTFKPIKVEDVREHDMHEEQFEISAETAQAILDCKAQGGRVVSCGTTATRVLETWAALPEQGAYKGGTRIYIYPGINFKCVDALITNFHLPDSTLILLVSAFAGTEAIRNAYKTAVAERYRFFSFGDAMFIE